MKLVRYGNPGREKPGLIDAEGKLRDLSAVVPDIGPQQLGQVGLARLRKMNPAKLPLVRGKPRYGCPVNGVGKFIAIGLNYAHHAAESGAPIPKEPVVFMKAPEPGQANLPPSAGLQFFGQVDIDGRSEVLTVRLKDASGATLFTQELAPEV